MTIELTPKEEARQLASLTKVRYKHHDQLVESGIARRIIELDVPVNKHRDKSEFTEGTLLFPTRQNLSQIALGHLWGSEYSIQANCSRFGARGILEGFAFLGDHPNSHEILLQRMDAKENGFNVNGFTVGVQLDSKDLSAGNYEIDGVLVEDLDEITRMLHELEGYRESGELSCLDPESLLNTTIGRDGPTPMP